MWHDGWFILSRSVFDRDNHLKVVTGKKSISPNGKARRGRSATAPTATAVRTSSARRTVADDLQVGRDPPAKAATNSSACDEYDGLD